MPTAVITGCNSGLGFAFAKLLLEEGHEVFATDAIVGERIESLGCCYSHLDVTDPGSIDAFAKQYGSHKPLDILLNIAGIMVPPEQDSLKHCTMQGFVRTFEVNTFGPFLLAQALLPNLLKAKTPRLAVMSSRLGSIQENRTGGFIAYRASKTAVNSLYKSLAVELKDQGVIVSMLHPGFVKTNLSPHIWEMPDAREPDEPVKKLWKLMLSKGIEDTGKFWDRDGFELPL